VRVEPIADRFERRLCTRYLLGGAKDIQVGLDTQAGVRDVVGRLSKALDDDVLDAGLSESAGRFLIGRSHTLKAEGIVCEIGLQPTRNPRGNVVQCELYKRESEVCEFTEVQEGVPLGVGELLQGLRIGVAKSKRRE
jgi:hypothetical protein